MRDVPTIKYLVVAIIGIKHLSFRVVKVAFREGVAQAVDDTAQGLAPRQRRINHCSAVDYLEIV